MRHRRSRRSFRGRTPRRSFRKIARRGKRRARKLDKFRVARGGMRL